MIQLGDKVRYIGTLLLAVALAGCQYIGGDVWFEKKVITPEGIKVVLAPEDVPKFRRTYTLQLKSRNLSMEITTRKWSTGIMYSGELDQPGGKWVLFDPESPADKILDREIIGEVEQRCKEIIAMDKEWRSSKPSQFTDESGQVWERKHD